MNKSSELQTIQDFHVQYQLTGKIFIIANNRKIIPSKTELENFVLTTLRGEKFLQLIQESDDDTLASINRVEIFIMPPIGFSINVDDDDNDKSSLDNSAFIFVVVIIIAFAMILIILIYFLFYISKKRRYRRELFHFNSNQLQDDCSTSSPGSRLHDLYSINARNDSSLAEEMKKNHKISLSSISETNSSVIKPKGFREKEYTKGVANNFETLWCSNSIGNENDSILCFHDSESTDTSTIRSPKRFVEVTN